MHACSPALVTTRAVACGDGGHEPEQKKWSEMANKESVHGRSWEEGAGRTRGPERHRGTILLGLPCKRRSISDQALELAVVPSLLLGQTAHQDPDLPYARSLALPSALVAPLSTHQTDRDGPLRGRRRAPLNPNARASRPNAWGKHEKKARCGKRVTPASGERPTSSCWSRSATRTP